MKTITLLVLTFALVGCGYTFQGSRSSLPPDIKSVQIARVDNLTTQTGLDVQLQEALRDSFERYGAVRVVDREGDADAVLKIRIEKVDTDVRSVTGESDIAVSSDLVMVLSGELTKTNGQILWRDESMEFDSDFANVSEGIVAGSSSQAQSGTDFGTLQGLESRELSRGQQRQALEGLVDEASRKIYLESVSADF
ncbi:hypothetical protein JNK13_05775 [bacterium]|nr:hypothetical protein [bacterium]